MQPEMGSQRPSARQALAGGGQATGWPGWQEPPAQAPSPVQRLPSSQGSPSLAGRHWPFVGSQVAQGPQSVRDPGWQAPARQVSSAVQASPSSQGVPLRGRQVPTEPSRVQVWQSSSQGASQQTPADREQTSPAAQSSSSSQEPAPWPRSGRQA